MSDELPSGDPPEPRAGRDLEGERIFNRLRTRIFGGPPAPTALGRWHLLERRGKGAMGVVYAAHDPELDRRVAIKVLHAMSQEADEARRLRLRREAQAMARVRHRNLVQVHDVYPDAPQPFVVMELIDGESLRTWQERPERTWRELVDAYHQAAMGLAALHDEGLVHRDFKPDNALVEADGTVRVVDFGLVHASSASQDGEGPLSAALTREGALVGTPSYMAPEQLRGGRGDARSDQYSLCRSLYEAVYCARPFVGADPESLLASMAEGPPPLRPNPRGAPRWLGAVLRRGLAVSPGRRFPSMRALAEALTGRQRRRPLLLLGLAAASLVGLLAFALGRDSSPCDAVAQELGAAWDEDPALERSFLALDLPGADFEWALFKRHMHDNREEWIRQRKQLCIEQSAGQPPGSVRARCLEQARAFIVDLADIYRSPSPVLVAHARQAATQVASHLADCQRAGAIAPDITPPLVAPRLQAALDRALVEQSAGRLAHAEAVAHDALDAARREKARPGLAEALHRLGRVLGHRRRPDDALRHLEEAVREATIGMHDEVRVDAQLFAAKIYVLDIGAVEAAEAAAEDAALFIARLAEHGFDTRRQEAELLEVRGFTADARGDVDAAVENTWKAFVAHRQLASGATGAPDFPACPSAELEAELAAAPIHDLDVVRNLHSLAAVHSESEDPAAAPCAERLFAAALDAAEATLGRHHPVTLDTRFDFATHLYEVEQGARALEVLQPALDASRFLFGDDSAPVADALLLRSNLMIERGDVRRGLLDLERAATSLAEECTERGCPVNYGAALLSLARALEMVGDREAARERYLEACDQLARHAQTAENYADCALLVASVAAKLDRRDEAEAWLTRAEELFQRQGRETDALDRIRQRIQRQTQENRHAPDHR